MNKYTMKDIVPETKLNDRIKHHMDRLKVNLQDMAKKSGLPYDAFVMGHLAQWGFAPVDSSFDGDAVMDGKVKITKDHFWKVCSDSPLRDPNMSDDDIFDTEAALALTVSSWAIEEADAGSA